MLASVLHCKRLDLYLLFDKPVNEAHIDEYRSLVKRRSEREPLQYILGEVEFYSLTLKVTPAVLIPRPETELLVAEALDFLQSKHGAACLDIGAGSGNISIAIAVNHVDVRLTAIDASENALAVARENAQMNNVSERIEFLRRDIFSVPLIELGRFELIVSNPPYVSKADYQTLQEEITKYEPAIAVTDDADGYNFYRTIIPSAYDSLRGDGALMIEAAQGQSEILCSMFKQNGFCNISVIKDYAGIERIIKGEKK
jgi:release factor glutamine methyltransferase